MIDLYVVAASLEALDGFCAPYTNVIGPCAGRAAVAAQTLEDGSFLQEQPACGDPSLFYACLRIKEKPALPDGIEICPPETGVSVLGRWA